MEKMKNSEKIIESLQNGEVFETTLVGYNNAEYKMIIYPKTEKGVPFALMVPKNCSNTQIVMETNNCEQNMLSEEFVSQAANVVDKLLCITKNNPCPIFVPLIPSVEGGVPYFQQLSKECLLLDKNDSNYRIDLQVIKSLDIARELIEKEIGQKPKEKVFFNGYSASACFAQRFCLVHPELVKTCVLGGASGSIPVPTEKLCYPIGIKDFNELTGKEFSIKEYEKIDFHYFVGELETQNKSDKRVDDFGHPAPMHDMSYMERSVPKEVAEKQREMFGENLFERADCSIQELHSMGISVEYKVLHGLTHKDIGREVVVQPEKVFDDQFESKREF